jgi:hypothetical protein
VAQIQDIVIRNGSVITGGAGHGIEAYAGNRVVVTNSRVSDHAGDGILCSKAECHVGDGAGLGNVISGHDTVGAFGIHCASGGIAYCDAGENTFANNTTDIDPACAATCPH